MSGLPHSLHALVTRRLERRHRCREVVASGADGALGAEPSLCLAAIVRPWMNVVAAGVGALCSQLPMSR